LPKLMDLKNRPCSRRCTSPDTPPSSSTGTESQSNTEVFYFILGKSTASKIKLTWNNNHSYQIPDPLLLPWRKAKQIQRYFILLIEITNSGKRHRVKDTWNFIAIKIQVQVVTRYTTLFFYQEGEPIKYRGIFLQYYYPQFWDEAQLVKSGWHQIK
jgi:hypothetical protein